MGTGEERCCSSLVMGGGAGRGQGRQRVGGDPELHRVGGG